jgi:hypothetical protein
MPSSSAVELSTVNRLVPGSNPAWAVWGCSSIGRAESLYLSYTADYRAVGGSSPSAPTFAPLAIWRMHRTHNSAKVGSIPSRSIDNMY